MTNDNAGAPPAAGSGKEPWAKPIIEVFPITEVEGSTPSPPNDDGITSIS
ncbi:MAG TPA: hypothetical protein VGG29_09280 [Caulobacteraceae bacterium]